jgi:hypothetical protein
VNQLTLHNGWVFLAMIEDRRGFQAMLKQKREFEQKRRLERKPGFERKRMA